MVLIDAGTEYRGYASDITRSWPVGGQFSEAQRELYTVVLDAQKAAIDACRVGQPYNAPHDTARRVLAEGLIQLVSSSKAWMRHSTQKQVNYAGGTCTTLAIGWGLMSMMSACTGPTANHASGARHGAHGGTGFVLRCMAA